jgi:DNA processing protein
MNYLLALHFLKGLTNRQKKTLFYSEEWKRHGPEFAISAVLKKMIDGTSNWDNALLCMNEEQVIIQNEGITLLTFDMQEFPELLRQIPDPPMALFGRGTWDNRKVPLAIVGTRKPSSYGLHHTKMIVRDLSRYPVNILSGLAFGIDACAHEASLDCGATTHAFVAGGLHKLSPKRNEKLAISMVNNGGGFFTEQSFYKESLRNFFPVRNRLIAGAALSTLVIEAAAKSGALITANQAFTYNREVYALPGALFQPNSLGPNLLIEQLIARPVVQLESFPSTFYPLWIENTQKIDLSTSIEGRLIREFPHGRIVDSSYLKTKLNSSNAQIFKGLKILVDLGLLDRVGPHRYCRKTVSN